jgi:hypothetical protein
VQSAKLNGQDPWQYGASLLCRLTPVLLPQKNVPRGLSHAFRTRNFGALFATGVNAEIGKP